jgi:hypothetical protein
MIDGKNNVSLLLVAVLLLACGDKSSGKSPPSVALADGGNGTGGTGTAGAAGNPASGGGGSGGSGGGMGGGAGSAGTAGVGGNGSCAVHKGTRWCDEVTARISRDECIQDSTCGPVCATCEWFHCHDYLDCLSNCVMGAEQCKSDCGIVFPSEEYYYLQLVDCIANNCRGEGECLPNESLCSGRCIDTQSADRHCGGCNAPCPVRMTCVEGQCRCPEEAPTFCDCSCIDTDSDFDHCGACGSSCHAPLSCVEGTCACPEPTVLCGHQCVDTNIDPANCGECGQVCPEAADSSPLCTGGKCIGLECDFPFGDCDGDTSNGCEVDHANDIDHCGWCDIACGDANGVPTCSLGKCGIVCSPGYGDCNGFNADGCERDLSSSVQHCGACGNACSGSGGTASCEAGICQIGCGSVGGIPHGDCNQSAADGCETALDGMDHCGECDNACHPAQECITGHCEGAVPLAEGVLRAVHIAIDDERVFFSVDNGNGTIRSVDKTGGTSTTLAGGQQSVVDIVVDASYVYIAAQHSYDSVSHISRVPVTGGTVELLVSGELGVSGLAVAGSMLYWTRHDAMGRGTLMRRSIAGGVAESLASSNESLGLLISDGLSVFWQDYGQTCESDAILMSLAVGGGPVEELTPAMGCGYTLAFDSSNVYWTKKVGGLQAVGAIPKSGGSAVTIATLSGTPGGLAVDDSHVYWADTYGGQILRAPLSGGAPETVASSQLSPNEVAVDDTHVYWTCLGTYQQANATVMKKEK